MVAVEASAIEAEIVAERAKGCAVGEQVADGADIAVVGAMLHERDAVGVSRGGRVAGGEVIEYQVGAAVGDPLKQRRFRWAWVASGNFLYRAGRGRGMGWKRKMWATGGLP
jgi:hypothetical protein